MISLVWNRWSHPTSFSPRWAFCCLCSFLFIKCERHICDLHHCFFMGFSQPQRMLSCRMWESVPKSKVQSCQNYPVSTNGLSTARKHWSIWSIICHVCDLDSKLHSLSLLHFNLWITGNFLSAGGRLDLVETDIINQTVPSLNHGCSCNTMDTNMRTKYRELLTKKMYFLISFRF